MTSSRLVHIVDDEESMRRSTSYALKTAGYAVATWTSGMAFLKETRHIERGCILLDIRMPEIDGLQVQRMLAERGVTMPVVVMTGHGDIAIAVRAMKGGAADFLEKPFERTTLLSAVETAFDRIAHADAAAARAADAELILGSLTPRERDVLDGLAHGLPNKTIAYDLGISPRTVEVHRANLMTKMSANSLSDLVRMAMLAGILGEPRKP